MYRGNSVTLRPFGQAEAERYLEWVNSAEVASQVGRALPVSPLEHSRWYEQNVQRSDAVFFAIYTEDISQYVGNVWLCDIHPINRTAELRILIGDPQAQGRGFGTDACQTVLDFAFRRLNLHKVYVHVLSSNQRATRAFQKAGFRPEALLRSEYFVDGQYQDVYRLSMLSTDPWPEPAAEGWTEPPAET